MRAEGVLGIPSWGKVLARAPQSLRLARGKRHSAGAVERAAPDSAAPLELVLPYPAHLHGDGGDLSASVPGTRHFLDRVAARGAVFRRALPTSISRRRAIACEAPISTRDPACGSARDMRSRACSNGFTASACAPDVRRRSSGASSGSCKPPAIRASLRSAGSSTSLPCGCAIRTMPTSARRSRSWMTGFGKTRNVGRASSVREAPRGIPRSPCRRWRPCASSTGYREALRQRSRLPAPAAGRYQLRGVSRGLSQRIPRAAGALPEDGMAGR